MAGININVFGAAKVTADGSDIGYTVDGVDITLNYYWKPVYTDVSGPMVGHDQQYFLQDATIKCNFDYYDPDAVNDLISGTLDSSGKLAVAQDMTFEVVITPGTGTGMDAITFPNCIVDPSSVQKLGSVAATNEITFKAIPNISGSSTEGVVLFTVG